MNNKRIEKAAIEETENKTTLHISNLTIKIHHGEEEAGPLNPLGEEKAYGITIWENEYLKIKDNKVEYSGGQLIKKYKAENKLNKTICKKVRQLLKND